MGDVAKALAKQQCGQNANADDHHGDGYRQTGSALHHVVEERLVLHHPQEPGRDQVGELADEVLNPHEPGAFVIVGRQLVSQSNPRRGENRVGQVEDERTEEEVIEVEAFALARRQLPEKRKAQACRNGAREDVGPSAPPARVGMVGDVAHQGVGERIGEPRERAEQTDQSRVHAETQVEHDGHAADGGCQQVVDEGSEPVDDLVRKADPVFRRGGVVLGGTHRYARPRGFRPIRPRL